MQESDTKLKASQRKTCIKQGAVSVQSDPPEQSSPTCPDPVKWQNMWQKARKLVQRVALGGGESPIEDEGEAELGAGRSSQEDESNSAGHIKEARSDAAESDLSAQVSIPARVSHTMPLHVVWISLLKPLQKLTAKPKILNATMLICHFTVYCTPILKSKYRESALGPSFPLLSLTDAGFVSLECVFICRASQIMTLSLHSHLEYSW